MSLKTEKKPKLTPEQRAENKRTYMREYMKKWKQEKYEEDPEAIRVFNRNRHYVRNHGAEAEELDKYGNYLSTFKKVSVLMKTLQDHRPDLVEEVLQVIRPAQIPV
jgi:hypothetical protein